MKVWHFHLIVVFSICLFLPATSQGQRQQVKQVIDLFNEGQLTRAKQLIDDIVDRNRARNNPNVWYARGYIYTEFFRLHRQADTLLKMREVAYNGFMKLLDLNCPAEFRDKVDQKLMFLANCYYGDAMRAVKKGNPEQADNYYQWYRKCARPVSEHYRKLGTEFEQRYRLALAEHYWSLVADNPAVEQVLVKIKSNYSSVLAENRGHPEANYRLSLLFYKQAAGEWPCRLHEPDYLIKQAMIHLNQIKKEDQNEKMERLRKTLEAYENESLNAMGR